MLSPRSPKVAAWSQLAAQWGQVGASFPPARTERRALPVRRRADTDAAGDLPAPVVPGYVRDRRGTWRYAATGRAVPGARDLTLRALHRFPIHRGQVLVPVDLVLREFRTFTSPGDLTRVTNLRTPGLSDCRSRRGSAPLFRGADRQNFRLEQPACSRRRSSGSVALGIRDCRDRGDTDGARTSADSRASCRNGPKRESNRLVRIGERNRPSCRNRRGERRGIPARAAGSPRPGDPAAGRRRRGSRSRRPG